jgi:hypothetical protein
MSQPSSQPASQPTSQASTTDPHKRCLNCNAILSGEYCSTCSQSARTARLTLRSIWTSGVQQVWDIDHPILNTLIGLTLRPGVVAREYVDGKRIKYVHPLKYCLICSAIQVLMIKLLPTALFGVTKPISFSGSSPQAADVAGDIATNLSKWTIEYLGPLTIAMMPVLALALHMLIRRGGRTFAESLVLSIFVYGHSLLIIAILLPTFAFSTPIGLLSSYAISYVLLSWSATQFYAGRPAVLALLAFAAHTLFVLLFIAIFSVLAAVALVLFVSSTGRMPGA